MRYPGSEKLEIIRLVEHSHLPVRRTLATLGILPMTFYRWCSRAGGRAEPLDDKSSRPQAGVEPDSGRCSGADRRTGAGRAGAVATGGGDALHRREEILCVGGIGLSAAQSSRPDHEPGLHRRESCRRVQGQDDGAEPAVADRLHLSQGDRLGLVLPVDHPRRLLALHHRPEAVHDHASRGCDGHTGTRAQCIRLRERQGRTATTAASEPRR
jgi:hypothetical protein